MAEESQDVQEMAEEIMVVDEMAEESKDEVQSNDEVVIMDMLPDCPRALKKEKKSVKSEKKSCKSSRSAKSMKHTDGSSAPTPAIQDSSKLSGYAGPVAHPDVQSIDWLSLWRQFAHGGSM